MKNKVATIDESKEMAVINSPAEMIKVAISGKADLNQLEKLLTLQERWEANEARKAYHQAMAEFKANPPKIDKDRQVDFALKTGGRQTYRHASLFNVTEKISTELSKYGLSVSWSTKQNGSILVTCKISHIKGHYEETTLSAPADTSGYKNSIQAIGSTITYLERYTLLALTGLATYDQDDDGNAAQSPTTSKADDLTPPKEIVTPAAQKETPATPQPVKEPEKNNTMTKLQQINAKFRELKTKLGEADFRHILQKNKYKNLQDIKTIADAENIIKQMESVFNVTDNFNGEVVE